MCVQNISLYVQDATTSDLLFSLKYRGKLEVHISNSREKESLLFTLQFFKQKTWAIVWPYIMSIQYK